jgi:hypothetical protein
MILPWNVKRIARWQIENGIREKQFSSSANPAFLHRFNAKVQKHIGL